MEGDFSPSLRVSSSSFGTVAGEGAAVGPYHLMPLSCLDSDMKRSSRGLNGGLELFRAVEVHMEVMAVDVEAVRFCCEG